MEFEINNEGTLAIKQEAGYDSAVLVEVLDGKDKLTRDYLITPGDFITMLNWYQYQREIGNTDLDY